MKCKAEITIKKYLPLLNVKGRKLELKNLPAFFQSIYSFDEVIINEKPYLVINVKDKRLGPREFKKHARILEERIAHPQIWFIQELHFHKVQRLIQSGINFIIEDKQVHLPVVNTSLRSGKETVRQVKIKLNGLAVNILARQILKEDLSGEKKLELAHLFEVNQMTMARALEPLIANELCVEKKEGVSKFISFKERNELWNYFKDKVESPVREVIYTEELPKKLAYSGITALARRTMLAEDQIPTFAIGKKKFKKKFSHKQSIFEEFAKAKVELWDREPTLVSNETVNILDIYLIHKNDKDERVQIELEKLLKENGLEIGQDND